MTFSVTVNPNVLIVGMLLATLAGVYGLAIVRAWRSGGDES